MAIAVSICIDIPKTGIDGIIVDTAITIIVQSITNFYFAGIQFLLIVIAIIATVNAKTWCHGTPSIPILIQIASIGLILVARIARPHGSPIVITIKNSVISGPDANVP